ncbi:MAG: esterase [Sphingomonadales bacterium]|nr:esterase [Sphingomonadales bacterium]
MRIPTIVCCILMLSHAHAQEVPVPSTGRVVRHTDVSSTWVPSRPVDVWLPPTYDGKTPHDVLIMHDGQMLFDKSGTWNGTEWRVDEVLSDLIAKGLVRPTLVVGVWNRPDFRHVEYSPQKPIDNLDDSERSGLLSMHRPDGEPLFPDGMVESDAYLSFLVTELLPFIRTHYVTYKESGHNYMAGSSMGGLISLYGWIEYPEVFEGAACLSTHWLLGFDAKTNHAPVLLEYLRKSIPPPARRRLYMDTGDQELDAMYLVPQSQADSIFLATGYTPKQFLSRVAAGHRHCEVDWAKRLPGAFRFMMGKADDTPAPANNSKREAAPIRSSGSAVGSSKGANANSESKKSGNVTKTGSNVGTNASSKPKN